MLPSLAARFLRLDGGCVAPQHVARRCTPGPRPLNLRAMHPLPAFSLAHSHAFQRGMRGSAQRPVPGQSDDFWGWREAMYGLAASLTPESIYRISLVAYRELAAAGVLTVGEFHYVHHQADGTPYDDRLAMSEAVIRAAKDAGIRIALLRVIYARAGAGKPPSAAQRRFCDGSLDAGLADVASLAARYHGDPDVRVGIAPHSVRAIPPSWLAGVARFADDHRLPVHMHVAEQPAEIEACLAETGRRPVELLAEHGVLSDRFVAVHATHITEGEARLLGAARSFACLCPTTERDLGDGLPDVGALVRENVRICLGVDSYIMSDPFEEMRGVILGERLRTGRRFGPFTSPAESLWKSASLEGAASIGFADAGGHLEVVEGSRTLELVADADRLEALVFSGSPSIVARVRRG
ncbi:MAG: formimidoylglutamate deiminase [Polyangiaceae bacterium]